MQRVIYSDSKLENIGTERDPPQFYSTFLENCHFEVSNNHLTSDRCQQSSLTIGQILQETNIFSRLQHQEKWFESIDILVQILEHRGSINDGEAQSAEFESRFTGMMPTALRGVESVWRHIFEYHYSAATENAEVSRTCCEILTRLLCHKDGKGIMWEENDDSHPHTPLVSQKGRILHAIVNAAHKYSTNDIIAGWTLKAFFARASQNPCPQDFELIEEHLKLIIMPFTMVRITNREFILHVFTSLNFTGRSSIAFLVNEDYKLAELMLEILMEYEQDLEIVKLAFSILCNLMRRRTHDIRTRMMMAKGHERIVNGMKMFSQDADIAVDGCSMIMVLAEYDLLHKTQLGRIGACEAVVNACTCHFAKMRTLGIFRPLIRHLAYGSNENKLCLQAAGAGDFCSQLNIGGWLDDESEDEQGGDY